jgi:hypothetical protein
MKKQGGQEEEGKQGDRGELGEQKERGQQNTKVGTIPERRVGYR